MATRLIIVDDHPIVRDGLRSMLSTERWLDVVGEAESGKEACDMVRRLEPDLVLMDIRMPDMDGLAATRQIKQEFPSACVVMLTIYDDPDYLLEAIAAGAAGYVLKDVSRRDLLHTLRTVAEGGSFLNPELMTRTLQRLAAKDRLSAGSSESPIDKLTTRELEVLQLVTNGLSNKEIAAELVIGLATVKTHVEHIIQKLHVSDRTQAAVLAVRRGLVKAAEESPGR